MRYEDAMREAMGLARRAAALGDVPVGAVLLDAGGAVIGRGANRRERCADPLAHAEVEALRDAAQSRGTRSMDTDSALSSGNRAAPWNLSGCTLVVTLEPCPMCAGAALQTHIDAIVFGAWDPKMGACGSVWDIARDPHVGHHPQVRGGVCEVECTALLSDFFATRRTT
ncbi:nucleoside deaminase [Bifidobacterium mongoliense]|uniref:nucleoside deaminase n=1 Tax=Bifidobacterium mongoliense TaxID=518643 RepID=UPI0030EF10DD